MYVSDCELDDQCLIHVVLEMTTNLNMNYKIRVVREYRLNDSACGRVLTSELVMEFLN